ncbi:MAG: carboxypeptidase regulatory-like domain-containing protein [Salibacteraceae bacterium]
MKTRLFFLFALVGCFLTSPLHAQNLTQTVRGTVSDQDAGIPLPGANIILLGSDPIIGASTDINGNFRLDNVPVGRIALQVTYTGYEERVLAGLLVTAGKELVLQIEIVESVASLEEVEITARKNKAEVINEMALSSARTFSVEETKRFSGTFNDPARMVSAFAGVQNDPGGNNDIVVRGNSPRGILWRLEGIEIPNPNHFANEGATGGPINALNSDMLSNSDFFSGAFAPEYGNAYSGVFDMKLRQGNNENREYSMGIGVLGIDATAEGPFKKGGQASYLANYRYSSLALLDRIGIVDFDGVPVYQDAAFKVHLPTENMGVFSAFGLGGLSSINYEETDEEDESEVLSKGSFGAGLGVVGVTNTYMVSDKTYFRSYIALSGTNNSDDYFEAEANDFVTRYTADFNQTVSRFSTTMHHKFNARNKLQAGVIYSHYGYRLTEDEFDDELQRMVNNLDVKGDAGLIQSFASWKHRLNEELTLVTGAHYSRFLLNNNHSFEPRMGLNYQFRPNQSFSAGFGIHSKLDPISVYLANIPTGDGGYAQLNKNLKLGKANHYVIGYDRTLGANSHIKIELYYQDLYHLAIEDSANSAFSLLNNTDGFSNRILTNEGTGRNYGMEVTLERFFARQYFYMATLSLYESKYTAGDGIERNTRFNGRHALNLSGGKEWTLGAAEKGKTLGFSTRIAWLGGRYYTPIDREASIAQNATVRDENRTLGEKRDDVFILNLGMTYRKDRKKRTTEVKLDFQNLTNNAAVVDDWYNENTGEFMTQPQLAFFPQLSYKVTF